MEVFDWIADLDMPLSLLVNNAGSNVTRASLADPAAARSSSMTASSRSICSTSRTRGRRRGSRGVAIAPHGSPGANSVRAAQRWNERIAASRCATELRAWPSVSSAR